MILIVTLPTRTEGKTLEFKRDLSSPDLVIRTIVAFANIPRSSVRNRATGGSMADPARSAA
jgi:hypothetical protein